MRPTAITATRSASRRRPGHEHAQYVRLVLVALVASALVLPGVLASAIPRAVESDKQSVAVQTTKIPWRLRTPPPLAAAKNLSVSSPAFLSDVPLDASRSHANLTRVVFWHIPKTGGSSVSSALFDAVGVPATMRTVRRVSSVDDCQQVILRSLAEPFKPVYHIHHKDYSLALAYKRVGFKLITILRHPIGRAISEYNYKRYDLKKPTAYELTALELRRIVTVDNMVRTLNLMNWHWTYECVWDDCRFNFCRDLDVSMVEYADSLTLTPQHLQVAIAAMAHTFDVISCLEHGSDRFKEQVRETLGATLELPKKNSSKHRSVPSLTQDELATLKQSSLDYQLYLHFCGESDRVLQDVGVNVTV